VKTMKIEGWMSKKEVSGEKNVEGKAPRKWSQRQDHPKTPISGKRNFFAGKGKERKKTEKSDVSGRTARGGRENRGRVKPDERNWTTDREIGK